MQQQQADLFVGPWESFLEALKDDVKHLGGSKAVGAWFIPEKSLEAQRNYVNDRLSNDRRERFSEEQENLIMRRAIQSRGFSAAHWHRCDALGTDRPKPNDPETERDRAQRAFIAAADSLSRSVDELKRMGISLPLRSVG